MECISFREYIESEWRVLSAPLFLRWESKAEEYDEAKLHYLKTGWNTELITFVDEGEMKVQLLRLWDIKMTNIKPKLFKSEYWLFEEFLKHLALWVWDLFKADKLAKMLGSSRRKVHKYMEILEEEGIIVRLLPFCENSETELSRHEKVYFSDLSFLHAILGPIYYFWDTKKGIIENFVFLELRRKLDATHEIYFYRKKSQADISFVLRDTSKDLLTPIDVIERSSSAISQTIKTFDASYHDRVERYMILTEHNASQVTYNDRTVFFLPHIAI